MNVQEILHEKPIDTQEAWTIMMEAGCEEPYDPKVKYSLATTPDGKHLFMEDDVYALAYQRDGKWLSASGPAC